ncbi:MAG: diguanylate cyclase [Solirubrobacteraceae bacterium]
MISGPQTSSSASRRSEEENSRGLDVVDLEIGLRAAVVTFAVAAALIPVIAVPIWKMATPGAIAAASLVSLSSAITLVLLNRADRVTQETLYVGDFVWIALTAGLVAGSAGRWSPFFLFYPLPVLHAGAFQSGRRLVVVSITATTAFLTPVAYGSGRTGLFVSMAIIAVPPTLVVAWGFNVALTTLRRQRHDLLAAALRAEEQAHTDALTGLGNFRLLWNTLEREAARARRHHGQFSLIVIDLNRFKAINDEFGHPAGDATLRAVATALRGELREEDVCFRHGGDEFAVVAVGTGEREASELTIRLVDTVAKVPIGSKLDTTVGAAAGWATFSDTDSDVDALMRTADAMLLERKYGHSR